MNEADRASKMSGEHLEEKLDPEVYAALAECGWRIPQTQHEVLAAEASLGEKPQPIPERFLSQESLRGSLERRLGPEHDNDREWGLER